LHALSRFLVLAIILLIAPIATAQSPGDAAPSGDTESRALPSRITPLTIQQAELELKAAKLRLESLRLELNGARQREDEAEKQLGWMKTSLEAATTEEQRQVLREALDTQQQRLEALRRQRQNTEESLARTQARIGELARWTERLREAYAQQQEAALLADLKRLEERSAQEIARFNTTLEQLRGQLAALGEDKRAQRALLQARIDAAENGIFITQTRLKLASVRSAFDHLASRNREIRTSDIELLAGDLKKLSALQQELDSVSDLLGRKLELVKSQRQVLAQKRKAGELSARIAERIDRLLRKDERALSDQLDEAKALRKTLKERHAAMTSTYRELLNQDLTARQSFPRKPGLWKALLGELVQLPGTLGKLLGDEYQRLLQQINDTSAERTLGALLLILIPLGIGTSYHYRMRGTRRRALQAQNFATRISAIALHVLRGISIPASLLLGLGSGLWLIDAPTGLVTLVLLFFGTWVAIRFLRDVAYWFLVSPLVPATDAEVRLHHLISINIWVSGVLALLDGLDRLGLLSEPMALIAKRLFMLSLLPAVYLGFRLRALLIRRLRDHGTSAYWLWVVRMISLLVPLAMLGIAIPGLAGYMNLARLIAWYLIATILIIATWLVLRGLLGDLADAVGRYVARDEKRSALWYEGLIRPLHLVARFVLAVAAILALVAVYGLGRQSTILELVRTALKHPLFSIGDTTIDLAHLIISLIAAVGAFPAGSWIRRLSFDWLYAGVADRGMRNSLAVFTQYFTVLLGLLLAVNLLGINLTSLAVFAGALGVGIGFGLQNIANNFISGLILLAERPIRAGDWVTVGQYEGEITYIGIRSATVRTWDNQEVIIPNAELVSNAFTNWTRSDPVVRTVLQVGISYNDDPHEAARVIEEAVTMQPEVMLRPPPQVQLDNFGDSSVDFRVIYYVDVGQFGRMDVKSKVMFAIWDALKEAKIEIPFPQRDVHIREIRPEGDPAPNTA
jgi:potassium efflux system protein